MKKNIFYAQSGGVTPVINATALGLIKSAKKSKNFFGKIYAGKTGIIGALKEELIHFTDSIRNEKQPETDGHSAIKALSLALEIQKIIDQ